jgi:tRNA-(ms[2]io[6]A)-hydroxylase
MDSKRRLPLVKTPPAEGDAQGEPRPPWHWVGFGAVAIFVTWLPLSLLAGALASRIATAAQGATHEDLVRAAIQIGIAHTAALALGALAGGFVVGRWGQHGVGVREAALAGLAAACVAVGISCVSFGASAWSLLVVPVAVPMAALGGKLGVRRRARA